MTKHMTGTRKESLAAREEQRSVVHLALIAMLSTLAASFVAPAVAQAAQEKPAMQTATPKPSKSGHAGGNGVNYYYPLYGRGERLLLLQGGLGHNERCGPNLHQ